jgi:hypothetical protein
MKRAGLLLVLAALFLLVGGALAMDSDNYSLDWVTPLTGGGGGAATSTNYAVNITIGQSAIGTSAGASYEACLGYWCGGAAGHRIYLPLVLRSFS